MGPPRLGGGELGESDSGMLPKSASMGPPRLGGGEKLAMSASLAKEPGASMGPPRLGGGEDVQFLAEIDFLVPLQWGRRG